MATIKTKVKLIREMAAKQPPVLQEKWRDFLRTRDIYTTEHKRPLLIHDDDSPEQELKVRQIAELLGWPVITMV